MTTAKYIDQAWLAYLLNNLSAKAGEAQISDTRHAFFHGAMSMREQFEKIENTPESTPEEEEFIEALHAELDAFAEQDLGMPANEPDHKNYAAMTLSNAHSMIAGLIENTSFTDDERDELCICLSKLTRLHRDHVDTNNHH